MQENDKLLAEASEEALEAELKARKLRRLPPPTLTNPDWSKLTKYVTETVEKLTRPEVTRRVTGKDFEHWIFETVMETIYGKDFWAWWNKGPGLR